MVSETIWTFSTFLPSVRTIVSAWRRLAGRRATREKKIDGREDMGVSRVEGWM